MSDPEKRIADLREILLQCGAAYMIGRGDPQKGYRALQDIGQRHGGVMGIEAAFPRRDVGE